MFHDTTDESVQLLKQAKNHAVSILTGSRQVGKSTLMRMLRDELALPSEYYDLENPRHLALFEEGYSSFKRQNKEKLVFIDEFQYCEGIFSVFKAVYDLACSRRAGFPACCRRPLLQAGGSQSSF